MIGRRLFICAATALAWSACDFPPVPHGADAGVEGDGLVPVASPEAPPLYDRGREAAAPGEPERMGRPVEMRGRLVGNAVSSFVIESEETHSWTKLEITPHSQLRIGDQPAGLREIQPGSEVRATFVPVDDESFGFALEIVAEPEALGWRGARDRAPAGQEEATQEAQPTPAE